MDWTILTDEEVGYLGGLPCSIVAMDGEVLVLRLSEDPDVFIRMGVAIGELAVWTNDREQFSELLTSHFGPHALNSE